MCRLESAHGAAPAHCRAIQKSATCGPTVCVCVCVRVCMCGEYAMLLSETNNWDRCFWMTCHQARRRLWLKKKTKWSWGTKFALKGEHTFSAFLVLQIKQKEGAFSLLTLAPSQKRAILFETLAERPSRHHSSTCLSQLVCRVSLSLVLLYNVTFFGFLSAAFSLALYSLSLCRLHHIFFENTLFFVIESVLCTRVWWKEQFFKVMVRSRWNLWPRCVGACQCVIESRYYSGPFFLAHSLHKSRGVLLKKEKKMDESGWNENRNLVLLPCRRLFLQRMSSLHFSHPGDPSCFLPMSCHLWSPATPWSGNRERPISSFEF